MLFNTFLLRTFEDRIGEKLVVSFSIDVVCFRVYMQRDGRSSVWKNRQSDQMISREASTCYSRFDNSTPFFFLIYIYFFCGKCLARSTLLCSAHKYIYICIYKSYCFLLLLLLLHRRRTLERREYTKTLYKKKRKKREIHLIRTFFLSRV